MGMENLVSNNIPEYSVSDISAAVKQTVEGAFSRVRVRGELGRVTIAQSGHMYATLKDQNAVLDAVCWRGSLGRLSIQPEEGMEVICTGRLSTYSAGRSSYQIIIDQMEPAGEGTLLKLLEERKKKLAAEGLFDPNRKQALPVLPRAIGVITSPSGAVIRDIIHRISDRFPLPILLWPVPVQGEKAARAVEKAIIGMNALPDDQRPDVLIVARGGGSLEDLMPFQEEAVIRAVAESALPIISAIGHETDTTLIDYAADLRAPTPTAAAEMAVPVRAELMALILDDGARLTRAMHKRVEREGLRLSPLTRALANPTRLTESKTQRLDMAASRLSPAFSSLLIRRENTLQRLSGRIKTPQERVSVMQTRLENTAGRLHRAGQMIGREEQAKLNTLDALLESLSFKKVLSRGYAVIRDAQGKPVTHGAHLSKGDQIRLMMQDRDDITADITS